MNIEFNAEYLKECFKRRKKLSERKYPKKDWPVGYKPTKKEFEEWMEEGTGVPVSYHEEDIGGGRKRGVFTPIKKNTEILTDFEKALGNGQSVNFQIENPDEKLVKVSKEEFAKWMEKEKDIKTPPKESLVYSASGDIDGITVFMERKGKDGFIKESYYQPRSEEEKRQIIERNQKRREEEESQTENSPNSDKKDQRVEKEVDQQDFSYNSDSDNKGSAEKENKTTANQKSSSQNRDNKNIYYGIGLTSLVILLISAMVVWAKKKK